MTTSGVDAATGLADLVAAKALAISVCIPARDEATTIGPIVASLRRHLVDAVGLVDEVLVADDGSCDATAEVASRAGARVIRVADAHPVLDLRPGKGEAMWKALHAAEGDLVVWIDADLDGFDPGWVARLVAPLVLDPTTTFVKGHYDRGADREGAGGGRVTELVARPAISVFHPALGGIHQPLGGEYAGRRSTLEQVPFAGGYGVDLGLLIDIARRDGTDAIAQVDLGVRTHRNRPVRDLGVQAAEVLHVALRRAGVASDATMALLHPELGDRPIETRDRPPLASLDVPTGT